MASQSARGMGKSPILAILVQIVVGVVVSFVGTVLGVEYKRWRGGSHAMLRTDEEPGDADFRAYLAAYRWELIGACAGLVSGLFAGFVVWLIWRDPLAALVIGASCAVGAAVAGWLYVSRF
jgi:hypothetical protein